MTINDENPLKLFNSLTRSIEPYIPIHAGEARVYTCGPTVYNYPHIGNMRAYVFADTLGRALSYKGYALKHVINITDVGHLTDDGDEGEDKLEKMASEKSQDIWDIARHYTNAYWGDIKALNIRQPAKWSIATDYVPAMIEFAISIADKHCYECETGLYFDVSTVEDYGRLARAASDNEAEGRIDTVADKRNAADFAIWRKTPKGEKRQMEWDSPWGKGAPGWHLECSVMSKELLGFPFDIHTGGIDHREIHHANEIAQNQAIEGCGGLVGNGCAENSGAKMWMHNNFLIDRAGKMSKSSGEFLRVQLLIDKGFHPLAYRMMCLQAHYRSELEFSWDNLIAAFTRLKRLVMMMERMDRNIEPADPAHQKLASPMQKFDAAISDDLNSCVAITSLDEVVSMKKIDIAQKLGAIKIMDEVLGLNLMTLTRTDLRIRPKDAAINEDEIEKQLTLRRQAKMDKDFEKSDMIRDTLNEQGVELMDGDPLGWEWKI